MSHYITKAASIAALCLSLFSMPATSNQTVYQWRDKNGDLHFSDVPRQGAKEIEIKDPQTFNSNEPSLSAPPPPPPPPLDKNKLISYKTVTITSPRNGETLKNNTGIVQVKIQTEPKLRPEDSIQIIYDGKPQATQQNASSITITEVYRGQHTLKAQIINKAGKTLLSSDPITFYMQRPALFYQQNLRNRHTFNQKAQRVETLTDNRIQKVVPET